ncbi:hypothetical protein ACLOJK_008120 [Asimina triloba]
MAVFLIKFILSALSSLADLLSYVIFNGAAHILVLIIRAFRVPATLLEYAADKLKETVEQLIQLLIDAISTLISDAFNLLLEVITGTVNMTTSAVGDLMDKTKSSLEELVNVLLELLMDASQAVWTIVTTIWNNSKDAIGYVFENM